MIPSSLRLATSLCAATYLCACATYGTVAEPVPLGNGVYSIGAETGQRTGDDQRGDNAKRTHAAPGAGCRRCMVNDI